VQSQFVAFVCLLIPSAFEFLPFYHQINLPHVTQVLLPIANGSEEIEIVAIVDILRRAKVDVVVASIEKSVQILASRGIKIVADKLIGDAAESVYDLIILPVRQLNFFL
jgi:hypothetical protein